MYDYDSDLDVYVSDIYDYFSDIGISEIRSFVIIHDYISDIYEYVSDILF